MMSDPQLFAVTGVGPRPLPVPPAAADFTDLYQGLGLGVYSVLRTFDHNKFLWLEHHLARTVRSLKLLGWDYQLDDSSLRRALHEVCTAYPAPESRVRIDVLAAPVPAVDSRVLIALLPFTPLPPAYYAEGVCVDFVVGLARQQPAAKSADFAAVRKAYQIGMATAYERLMVNDQGEILEGISSNFYGVRAGNLFTASAGVLEGITRRILLELAGGLGIPVIDKAVPVAEIDQLDEAAISSSSRGLLPVVKIADHVIGTGRPGAVCRQLLAAYAEFVARAIRTAI